MTTGVATTALETSGGDPSDTTLAVDNYEKTEIAGQQVRKRPGPIAGDPRAMGLIIREKKKSRG